MALRMRENVEMRYMTGILEIEKAKEDGNIP